MTVFRFDHSRLDGSHITPQGFLKADAVPTKAGVFIYRMGDGSIRRELRPPEEVFNADSLRSLTEAPITNDHPPVPVDASNAKEYAVGFTGSKIVRKDNLAQMRVTVFDAKTIEEIMKGDKQELSGGYMCDVEHMAGEWNGMAYDAMQKNIRYNHLAIVTAGRAGPEARIKLDSQDAIMTDKDGVLHHDVIDGLEETEGEIRARVKNPGSFDPESLRTKEITTGINIIVGKLKGETAMTTQAYRFKKGEGWTMAKAREWLSSHEIKVVDEADQKNSGANSGSALDSSRNNGEELPMAKLKIDSVEYEISEAVAPVVAAKLDALVTSQKEVETLKGKTDGLEVELKKKDEEIKALKDATLSEKQILERADSLLKIHAFAKKILGEEVKLDGVDIASIKKQVVQKVLPDVKVDEKSDTYIDGVFDTLQQKAKDGAGDPLKEALGTTGKADGAVSSEQARTKSMERSTNLWKGEKAA